MVNTRFLLRWIFWIALRILWLLYLSLLCIFYIVILKIKVVCIGKTGKGFLIDGEKEYLNRLKHYVNIVRIEIPDIKNAKKLSIDQIKSLEGKEILSKVIPG